MNEKKMDYYGEGMHATQKDVPTKVPEIEPIEIPDELPINPDETPPKVPKTIPQKPKKVPVEVD